MKKIIVLISIIFLVTINFSYSQNDPKGHEKKMHREEFVPPIPNLTESQILQIKELHTSHAKEMMSMHNQIGELHAKLRTLTTEDNVDMDKVNSLIDEIGALQTKIMKENEANRQKIRKLLTEEQRVIFDTMPQGPPPPAPPKK